METRGIRNNNPCNIRLGSNWLGLRKKSTDVYFCQFDSMLYGIRAVFCLLDTYYNKYHLDTISKIIPRYAPASDGNHVDAYINFISNQVGIDSQYILCPPSTCEYLWSKIVTAMCKIESDYTPTPFLVHQSYQLYKSSKKN